MLLNGRDTAMLSEHSKTDDFIRFLGIVRRENPKKPVLLVLDNARIHHAKAVKPVREDMDIWLVFLPPYSPDLNPIEFAWKDGKKGLAMLGFEGIKEKVKNTVVDIMEQRKMGYSRAWTEKFPIALGSC